MPGLSSLRVAKTYAPDQNGAKRFARRHGEQLVCRHRGESTPIASRARTLVALRIPATDRATRTLLIAAGAQWKSAERYWLLPRLVAKNLRLLGSVVPVHG